jgi:protein-tyrosine phosphatase
VGALAFAGAWSLAIGLDCGWWGLPLAWASLSLGIVALAYSGAGPGVFRKYRGRISLPARLILAPYLLGAWISMRLYTRRRPPVLLLAAGLYVGRLPLRSEQRNLDGAGITAVVDMTAEFDAACVAGRRYLNCQTLDLTVPTAAQMATIVEFVQGERLRGGRLLIHCALGLSRGATAAMAVLIAEGVRPDIAEARLRAANPEAVVGDAHRAALSSCGGSQ